MARDAFSHVIPDRNLVKVLHECVRRALREHGRRRTEPARLRKTTGSTPKGRTIPAAVSREVWRRDDGSCAFVSADGRRCGSTYQVQLHHLLAYAKNGPATAANLSLRCSIHNRFHAEQDFGAEKMARMCRQEE
jgi:5-methylcytosine-specific restriction endonuclease McrA